MFVVDAKVFVYALNRSSAEYPTCRNLVEGRRAQSTRWYTTWGVLYEVMRVATHPRAFQQPESVNAVWRFIEVLLSAPNLGVLVEGTRHAEVVGEVLGEVKGLRGNMIRDFHTAALTREHGVRRIYKETLFSSVSVS